MLARENPPRLSVSAMGLDALSVVLLRVRRNGVLVVVGQILGEGKLSATLVNMEVF